MPKTVDLVGKVFGRLTVIERAGCLTDGKSLCRAWLCQCTCGNKPIIRGKHLTRKKGNVVSCGCYKREVLNHSNTTHGGKDWPEYEVWQSFRMRCDNPNNRAYHNYGARGITYDPRWNNFAVFIADMGRRPTDKHTLDRKDNDGNYCKDNCRWATRSEQARNKRNTVMYEYRGVTKALADWADEFGLGRAMVYMRYKAGCTGDQLFKSVEPGKRYRRTKAERGY